MRGAPRCSGRFPQGWLRVRRQPGRWRRDFLLPARKKLWPLPPGKKVGYDGYRLRALADYKPKNRVPCQEENGWMTRFLTTRRPLIGLNGRKQERGEEC